MKTKLPTIGAVVGLSGILCGNAQPVTASEPHFATSRADGVATCCSRSNAQPADFKTLSHSAARGDANAQYLLGRSYEQGVGVRENPARAAQWYRQAAEQGLAAAQYRLGRAIAAGEGVRQDYAEAMRWFLQAATQDYAPAMNRLGVMYEKGLGMPPDEVQAYAWYTMAAVGNQHISAIANREVLVRRMTVEQIHEGQRRADLGLARNSIALRDQWR